MDQLELITEDLEKVTIKDAHIKKLRVLERGSFSVLHLGELTKGDGSVQQVAVKEENRDEIEGVFRDKREEDDVILRHEAKVLAQLNHRNILKLVAFQSNPLMLILEYMEWGNLEEAVQVHEFSYKDILKSLHDIASGMEYVCQKKIVHKDLACRNIFVDSNKLCKVGDFGLSLYFGDSVDGQVKEKRHLCGMITEPPESRKNKIYSTKSDVWSFGFLMWELYFLREENAEYQYYHDYTGAVNEFRENRVLPRPLSYPVQLYNYVQENLFNLDPQKRVDFTSIKEKIGEML